MVLSLAVAGATGRMGTLIQSLIARDPELVLHAALDSRSSLESLAGADVIVDVTRAEASADVVEYAITHGINIVVGTSGWSAERISEVRSALGESPSSSVVFIPNFSVGSVLASSFAAQAARFFPSIEIVEAHHAAKVDSPSGTAVRTAELIGAARTESLSPPATEQRARGEVVAGVPIHSLRMNGVTAQQDVLLSGPGEILTLKHETLSPISYESGIARSVRFAAESTGVTVGLDVVLGLTIGQ